MKQEVKRYLIKDIPEICRQLSVISIDLCAEKKFLAINRSISICIVHLVHLQEVISDNKNDYDEQLIDIIHQNIFRYFFTDTFIAFEQHIDKIIEQICTNSNDVVSRYHKKLCEVKAKLESLAVVHPELKNELTQIRKLVPSQSKKLSFDDKFEYVLSKISALPDSEQFVSEARNFMECSRIIRNKFSHPDVRFTNYESNVFLKHPYMKCFNSDGQLVTTVNRIPELVKKYLYILEYFENISKSDTRCLKSVMMT